MADGGTLIPLSDEQAKLGQEIAKVFSGIGSFLVNAIGSTPNDLIGYLGGDWLRFKRAENLAKLMHLTKERLEANGIKDQKPASLSVALPILRCAADESREELQDLWARLLAATIDQARTGSVRQRFADAIAKMDPLDALVLINHNQFKGAVWSTTANKLGISRDQLEISVYNLYRLLMLGGDSISDIHLSPFGREFLRVVMGTQEQ